MVQSVAALNQTQLKNSRLTLRILASDLRAGALAGSAQDTQLLSYRLCYTGSCFSACAYACVASRARGVIMMQKLRADASLNQFDSLPSLVGTGFFHLKPNLFMLQNTLGSMISPF